MKRLFLLEDDLSLISGLSFAVKKQGYEIDAARTILEADTLWANGSYDLAILDVSLPDGSGFDFCRKIRRMSKVPVMFLTAADEETDIIMGLDMGGDDYITKPFSIDELGVRVMAHLRREKRGRQSKKESEETKGFRIRYDERSVRFDGEEIRLTKTEFDILEFLSMHPRQVFSKEQIYEAVRGLEGNGDNSIVTEHIRRLRGKIAQKTKEDYIETVWGVGYKWIG